MSRIDDIQYQIDTIKKDIENKSRKKSEAEGAIKTYFKHLKERYNVSSEKELEELIEETKNEIEKLNNQIETLFNEIVDEYDKATK